MAEIFIPGGLNQNRLFSMLVGASNFSIGASYVAGIVFRSFDDYNLKSFLFFPSSGTPGNFLIELFNADPFTGFPTGSALASGSTTISTFNVIQEVPLTGSLSLINDNIYAISISSSAGTTFNLRGSQTSNLLGFSSGFPYYISKNSSNVWNIRNTPIACALRKNDDTFDTQSVFTFPSAYLGFSITVGNTSAPRQFGCVLNYPYDCKFKTVSCGIISMATTATGQYFDIRLYQPDGTLLHSKQFEKHIGTSVGNVLCNFDDYIQLNKNTNYYLMLANTTGSTSVTIRRITIDSIFDSAPVLDTYYAISASFLNISGSGGI